MESVSQYSGLTLFLPLVIVHQAEGITTPVLLEDFLSEEGQKVVAVGIIEEDRLLGIAPRRDMVEGSRILQP